LCGVQAMFRMGRFGFLFSSLVVFKNVGPAASAFAESLSGTEAQTKAARKPALQVADAFDVVNGKPLVDLGKRSFRAGVTSEYGGDPSSLCLYSTRLREA